MDQFSTQTEEILKAIQQLPLEEQRKIAEEVLRQIEAQKEEDRRQAILALAGSWKYSIPKSVVLPEIFHILLVIKHVSAADMEYLLLRLIHLM